jgi:hypothetical protein
MPVMVTAMVAAGAVSDEEEPPAWPQWPPRSTRSSRKPLLEEALDDPTRDRELSSDERASVAAARKVLHDVRITPSKHPGMVPAFKFATNDGFIVTAREAAIIATKLRAYALHVDAAEVASHHGGYHID